MSTTIVDLAGTLFIGGCIDWTSLPMLRQDVRPTNLDAIMIGRTVSRYTGVDYTVLGCMRAHVNYVEPHITAYQIRTAYYTVPRSPAQRILAIGIGIHDNIQKVLT